MSRSNRAVRGLLALPLFLWLGSCQSTTVVEDEPVQQESATGRLKVEFAFAPEIAPDSLEWSLQTAKGVVAAKDQGTDSLQRRLLSGEIVYGNSSGDSLWVDFRKSGVRVSRIAWVRAGSSPFALRAETIRRDTLGRMILRRMHAAGLSGKVKADSVYASLLLDGKLEFEGFPDSVPGGMDVVKIRRLVLSQAVSRKVPLVQLADAWILDLTAAQARDSIHAMIVAGLVAPADTAALYPAARIRLTSPLSLDSLLLAGGLGRALRGKLVCEDGIQLLQALVLDDKSADASGAFAPLPPRILAGTEISLDTAGIVLQANPSTPAGTYRLRLRVLDRKPRQDSFDLAFQVVVPRKTGAPRISWISPSKDTVLTTKDSTWLAKVKVDDSLKIDSVLIGSKHALKVGDAWQVLDTIHVWGSPVSLVARAYNSGGRDTSVNSRTITLNAPLGDPLPEVVPVDPADGDDTIPFDAANRKISWKFAPGAVYKDVQAVLDLGNGSPQNLAATVKDSIWSTNVPLAPNGKRGMVKVLVVTASGYVVPVDTFWLTRRKDAVSPTITALAPPPVVNFDSLAVTLRWKVRDNHKMDTVKVNNVRVLPQISGIDTFYQFTLKLDTGTSKARIQAQDSTGNISRDSVSVIRLHSSDPPKIVRRTGTTDRSIEYRSTDSFTVAWTVTDKEKLDSVVIAGTTVKDSAGNGIFSRKVAIGPGANRIGIKAWGKYSAKSSVDTVEITTVVSDADLNKYDILLMPDGRVWMTANLRVTGGACGLWGCELSGRMYSWTRAMGLDTAYAAKSAGFTTTTVARGLCPSGWHVAQAREWSALYAATMPKGATDSALALRVDSGWTGTQGRNLWGNFLMANRKVATLTKVLASSASAESLGESAISVAPTDATSLTAPVGTTDLKSQASDIGTIGVITLPSEIVNQSSVWAPSEASATAADLLSANGNGTFSGTAGKTGAYGVRCIEDKKMIIRPIGVVLTDSLVVKPIKLGSGALVVQP